MRLPIYTIKKGIARKKDYYEILRPDGSVVNEARFYNLKNAEKKLSTLKAMGYCETDYK